MTERLRSHMRLPRTAMGNHPSLHRGDFEAMGSEHRGTTFLEACLLGTSLLCRVFKDNLHMYASRQLPLPTLLKPSNVHSPSRKARRKLQTLRPGWFGCFARPTSPGRMTGTVWLPGLDFRSTSLHRATDEALFFESHRTSVLSSGSSGSGRAGNL